MGEYDNLQQKYDIITFMVILLKCMLKFVKNNMGQYTNYIILTEAVLEIILYILEHTDIKTMIMIKTFIKQIKYLTKYQ
ncbi:hypothetical protein GNF86_01925 [Clostridium perfringens]